MIHKSAQIVQREWKDLRNCFEMCGDIGEFELEKLMKSRWVTVQGHEGFIANIVSMDKKILKHGYHTPEALNVLIPMASEAGEELGLAEELAFAFGMGYGFVRTGLLTSHRLGPRQILFHKMFFPFGTMRGMWDFNWDYDPSWIKRKLCIVFDRFKDWQNDPQLYEQDLEQLQNREEIWKEWDKVNY